MRPIDRSIDRLRGQFDGLRGVAAVEREELYSWMRNDSTKIILGCPAGIMVFESRRTFACL